LRSALDLLADEIDAILLYEARHQLSNPWMVVDNYIDVVLGTTDTPTLIAEYAATRLTSGQVLRLGKLVQTQLHRQRMFSSCGWFFDSLDRPEPRYVIAQAMRAIQLTKQAIGVDLGPNFRESLSAAQHTNGLQPGSIRTAADLYDEIEAMIN
jgi:hypothetical protein